MLVGSLGGIGLIGGCGAGVTSGGCAGRIGGPGGSGFSGADGGTVADWAVCAAGERESGDCAAGFFDVS